MTPRKATARIVDTAQVAESQRIATQAAAVRGVLESLATEARAARPGKAVQPLALIANIRAMQRLADDALTEALRLARMSGETYEAIGDAVGPYRADSQKPMHRNNVGAFLRKRGIEE